MKINGEAVRALREQRSWSQEHLASAAGLSVRTVQRVEVEGAASAETRLALAAALGVPVSDLIAASPSTDVTVESKAPLVDVRPAMTAYDKLMRKAILGIGVGLAFVVFAIALVMLASGILGYFP